MCLFTFLFQALRIQHEEAIYQLKKEKKASWLDLSLLPRGETRRELEKAIKNNEAKRDHCGTPLPSSREIGIQRDKVKVKKD